ncbi:MAG: tRNA (N6-threonylcarbamoyladenosine(37)-N6)-methyltransferase TrmO [Bacteroidales bacterium]|nr:tRNA (N6-threonylcarbamoyladenosine(37)-N6)-methyltransferase TrmO [Bacteroidales bacterium]
MEIVKIATYHSPMKEKFGVPRQSGLAPSLQGRIVFEPEYRDANALRGLEGFSHIWLLWGFSANRPTAHGHASAVPGGEGASRTWSPTVRPPRLGGNAAMGVFATRSPFRPNPIGLSAVKLESLEFSGNDGPVICVSGADLMDGTPIYDIKPYVTYADAHPEATSGFVDATPWQPLTVVIPEEIRQQILNGPSVAKHPVLHLEHDFSTTPGAKEAFLHLQALEEILAQDPRPQYHRSNPVISPASSADISPVPTSVISTVSSDVISTEAEKSPTPPATEPEVLKTYASKSLDSFASQCQRTPSPVISSASSPVISTEGRKAEAEKSHPKVYGLAFGPWNVRFTVTGTTLTVLSIE